MRVLVVRAGVVGRGGGGMRLTIGNCRGWVEVEVGREREGSLRDRLAR